MKQLLILPVLFSTLLVLSACKEENKEEAPPAADAPAAPAEGGTK